MTASSRPCAVGAMHLQAPQRDAGIMGGLFGAQEGRAALRFLRPFDAVVRIHAASRSWAPRRRSCPGWAKRCAPGGVGFGGARIRTLAKRRTAGTRNTTAAQTCPAYDTRTGSARAK